MKYDFRNSPRIEDKFHKKFIVTEDDLYDDIGDCVHVRHPDSTEEFRFYYTVEDDVRILDSEGIIQL